MTTGEKNEINSILRECFRYFVQNNMIRQSDELKMMYYIRDKIALRVTETSSYAGALDRVETVLERSRTELSDI